MVRGLLRRLCAALASNFRTVIHKAGWCHSERHLLPSAATGISRDGRYQVTHDEKPADFACMDRSIKVGCSFLYKTCKNCLFAALTFEIVNFVPECLRFRGQRRVEANIAVALRVESPGSQLPVLFLPFLQR